MGGASKTLPLSGGGENKEVTEWQIILEAIEEEELFCFVFLMFLFLLFGKALVIMGQVWSRPVVSGLTTSTWVFDRGPVAHLGSVRGREAREEEGRVC